MSGVVDARPRMDFAAHAAQDRLKRALFGTAQPMRQIGKYIVLEQLGRGGMGAVYAVYNPDLGRRSVIKLVLPGSPGDVGRRRLLQEARNMAVLPVHQNIVQVFDAGIHDDEVFIVMEYIAGLDLAAWLRVERRTWPEILAAFLDAGRGLGAIHQHNVTHRDFKPSNVMRSDSGRVCVLDFGLSRARQAEAPVSPAAGGSDERLTHTGSLVGTPRYMSPEQFEGADIDPRSDQFSFCVALWEALFNVLPFPGDTMQSYRRSVVAGELIDPTDLRGVPRRVVDALRRGLSCAPADRFPTMETLLSALAPPERSYRGLLPAFMLVTAGVAASLWISSPPPPPPIELCRDELSDELKGVWDDQQRAQVRGALVPGGHAAAVMTRLDDHAAHWLDVRTGVCAAHRSGGLSDALHARSVKCLDHHRAVLGRIGERLAASPGAQPNLGELPNRDRIDACADPLYITDPTPPSDSASDAVTHIEAMLADAESALVSGQYAESESIASSAVERARQTAHGPTLAYALYQQARVLTYGPNAANARPTLIEAARLANRYDLNDLAADIYLRLIRVTSSFGDREQEALVWFEVLLDKLTRLDERHGSRETAAFDYLGNIAMERGDLPAAKAYYELAERWSRDASPLTRSHPQIGLGRVLRRRGELRAALARFDEGLRLAEEELGPEHPKLLPILVLVAMAQADLDETGSASKTLARANSLLDNLPERQPYAALVHYESAHLARKYGDLDRAENFARVATQELRDPTLPRSVQAFRARALDLLGVIHFKRKDGAKAIEPYLELLNSPEAHRTDKANVLPIAFCNAAEIANSGRAPQLALRFVAAGRAGLAREEANLNAAARRKHALCLTRWEAEALLRLKRTHAAVDIMAAALTDWDPASKHRDESADEMAWLLFQTQLRAVPPTEAVPHAHRLRIRLRSTPPAHPERLKAVEGWLQRHSATHPSPNPASTKGLNRTGDRHADEGSKHGRLR